MEYGGQYYPESRAHCQSCGIGLADGETCPIETCPRYRLPADHTRNTGQRTPGVTPISRDEAAQMIFKATGNVGASMTPFHGEIQAAPMRSNLTGDAALAVLEMRAQLDLWAAIDGMQFEHKASE